MIRPHRAMRKRDLLALTGIMFAPAIITSGQQLLASRDKFSPQVPEFTAAHNYGALAAQGLQLAAAGGYIACRRLRLRHWSLRPTLAGTAWGLGLFAAMGLAYDLFYATFFRSAPVADEIPANYAEIDTSLLLYSAFNGFYEEFFFLVLCLSLPSVPVWQLFAYSLVVRLSFHTYQGWANALAISLIVGGTFFLADRLLPRHRLFAPVLAHTLGDIFGLGLLSLFASKDPGA